MHLFFNIEIRLSFSFLIDLFLIDLSGLTRMKSHNFSVFFFFFLCLYCRRNACSTLNEIFRLFNLLKWTRITNCGFRSVDRGYFCVAKSDKQQKSLNENNSKEKGFLWFMIQCVESELCDCECVWNLYGGLFKTDRRNDDCNFCPSTTENWSI